ncbi:MAG: hypothetical protein J6X28_05410 [Bacilli bacterium]|nr:hypothetical protein [Bacilli bacterium]
MKKRVNQSEIELAKKSSRILFLISFILLVLLFVGFGFLYALDINVVSFVHEPTKPVKKVEVVSDIIEEPSKKEPLNIENRNIQKLFSYVKVTNPYLCEEEGYASLDQIQMKKASDSCKYSIASMIYQDKVQSYEGKWILLEEDVENAYEELFGVDTYTTQEMIPCFYHTNFLYNGSYYFTESITPEEGSSLTSYEKVISAEREKNQLDITSAVIYHERVLSLFCKDPNCEEVISHVKKESEYNEEYLSLYVDYHQEHLNHITYHFEMDESGFYHYLGYTRTNQ